MTLPLYEAAAASARLAFKASGTQPSNAGLWYDRFFDGWTEHFTWPEPSKKDGDGDATGSNSKKAWIDTVTQKLDGDTIVKQPVGDAALLDEHSRRRHRLVAALGGISLRFDLDSRFATGLGRRHPIENGFIWHHTLGVPYLAGSGVKGLVRAWATLMAETAEEQARISRLLGPHAVSADLAVGSVIFLDALPVLPVQLVAEVMTPHYGDWHQSRSAPPAPPGDWISPVPIPFLAVAAQQSFVFAVIPRPASGTADDCHQAADWLEQGLQWLGAGAKTAIGMGRFAPSRPNESGAAQAAAPGLRIGQRGFYFGDDVIIKAIEGTNLTVAYPDADATETISAEEFTPITGAGGHRR